ncbi:hypothetical protein ACFLIM_45175 [Nonomuraea sp. M3C6]|uniref:Uncharacterized protein n=1 Tax=Nonomuraea marmarensis TaxID=3351344 RepID=A0ABW7AVX5_9ACTN
MSRLVSLAASVRDRPTVEQVDAMLTELQQMPRTQVVTKIIDDLLDYRAMLPV